MKLVLAVIFVCFLSTAHAIFGPQLQQKLIATEDNCLNKTIGLTQKNVLLINQVRWYRSLPDDGRLDKFAICILQRYNVINADGTLNEDENKYYLTSDNPKRKQLGRKCKANIGSSNEETARKILKCFLNTEIYMIDSAPRTPGPEIPDL